MNEIALPTVTDIEALKQFGSMIMKTNFFPQVKTVEQACVIILKAKELGIPPVQAFTSIAVINGKPTISAEMMLSLIYKNCKGAVVNYVETSETRCEIKAKRPEAGAEFCVFTFTLDDAKRAGLSGKGPWASYPAAMLRARCISAMARALFADALSGCVYTPEELGAAVSEDGELLDVTPVTKKEVNNLGDGDQSAAVTETLKTPPIAPVSNITTNTEPPTLLPGEFVVKFGKYSGRSIKSIDNLDDYITILRLSKAPEAQEILVAALAFKEEQNKGEENA